MNRIGRHELKPCFDPARPEHAPAAQRFERGEYGGDQQEDARPRGQGSGQRRCSSQRESDNSAHQPSSVANVGREKAFHDFRRALSSS